MVRNKPGNPGALRFCPAPLHAGSAGRVASYAAEYRQTRVKQAARQFWLVTVYGTAAFLLQVPLSGCNASPSAPVVHAAAAPNDPKLQHYKTAVEPVLQSNCLRCHGGMNRRGGLNMSTRANLMLGGKDGVVVVAGRPEDSLLVKVISPGLAEDDPMRMPPKGTRLSAEQVAAIRKWVVEGAVMDR